MMEPHGDSLAGIARRCHRRSAPRADSRALRRAAPAGFRPDDQDGEAPDDGRRTISQFAANLGSGLVGVFAAQNLKPLVIGSLATGLAALTDQRVRDAWRDPESGLATGGAVAGGAVIGAAIGGLFLVGRAMPSPGFRDASYDLGVAALVNEAYVIAIKAAVGRERPNGGNGSRRDSSFPSGHAATAFAVAAVVDRHASWKVSVPVYGLAAAIGVSRVLRDAHYLSDVTAGATLGIIVGHTVVRMNNRPRPGHGGATPPAHAMTIMPVLGRRTAGFRVAMVF